MTPATIRFVHDMKNYLGIVIGFSTLLLDEMPANDPRRLDVEQVRTAGERALELLEQWSTNLTNLTAGT